MSTTRDPSAAWGGRLSDRFGGRLRDNGPVWMGYHVVARVARRVSNVCELRARRLEVSRGLPGVNSRAVNRAHWSQYDWSAAGEEWTPTAEWRAALIEHVMLANMPVRTTTLEIGPGGGRWTAALHERSDGLVLVDITDRTLELCRELLGDPADVTYILTDGAGLEGVGDESVGYVWSFDAFVHIAPVDQSGYMRDLARVMRPGARAVIHHAGRAGVDGGWRSSMTAEHFRGLLEEHGLRLLEQFDRWGPSDEFAVPIEGDTISIFEKPSSN